MITHDPAGTCQTGIAEAFKSRVQPRAAMKSREVAEVVRDGAAVLHLLACLADRPVGGYGPDIRGFGHDGRSGWPLLRIDQESLDRIEGLAADLDEVADWIHSHSQD